MKKVVRIISVLMVLTLFFSIGCAQKTAAPAYQEKIIMKVATATTGDPQAMALEKLKAAVEKNTNGRIQVQTYPSGQMGSSDQMHQGLLAGSLQAQFEPTSFMGGFANVMNLMDLPYFFKDVWAAGQILNGPAGDDIRQYMEKNKGLVVGGLYPYGDRVTLTKFPVAKIEDLKGKKIRTGAKLLQDQWATWGATGVPMSVPELYTALQQGTLDGQESSIAFFASGKYHEVTKYLFMEPRGAQISALLINKKWLDSLPDGLGKVVLDSAKEIKPWYEQACRDGEKAAVETMKKAGLQVIESSPELHAKMVAAAKGVDEKFLKDNPDLKPIYDKLKEAVNQQK